MRTNENYISKRLKIQFALDENGNKCLAYYEDKAQNKRYKCPICGRPLILRKSNNTSINAKRPHFAHKPDTTHNSNAEGELHKTFKIKLYELLNEHLEKHIPFDINYECSFCNEQHSYNLLKNVEIVEKEKNLGDCRPDILLSDTNEKPIVAIEIVDTHEPEPEIINYYNNNKILLYKINLNSIDNLNKIEEISKEPTSFDYCIYSKCEKCGKQMIKQTISIEEIKCPHCNKNTIVATRTYDGRNFKITQDYYQSLQDKNVKLSRYRSGQYYNMCPHCKKLLTNECLENAQRVPNLFPDDHLSIYYCEQCDNTIIKQEIKRYYNISK